ncbi:hypothetical protein FE257_009512 [Aspergillus nanangensis]|uniref:Pentatricopeptide repeat protein n=1 Tax=Aspergillus nanangensis TaxID=2582783 RepID=A0AAD4CLM5_ASPNN|nr:hypothetical protein FE257_009512 [Aspergillus nanangensis]
MSNPDPLPYNASVRRLGPRRIRPTVASIADVFVGSLVMAGYCREHSPRGRGLSTMSINMNSPDTMARWRKRQAATANRLPRKRPDYLGSSGECLSAVNRSTAHRMFNSGVAPRIEEEENEADRMTTQSIGNSSIRRDKKERDLNASETLLERPHYNVPEVCDYNSMATFSTRSDDQNDARGNLDSTDDPPNDRSTLSHPSQKYYYQGKTSPSQEKRSSMSKLYHAVFGRSLGWNRAVKIAAQQLPVVSRTEYKGDKSHKGRDAVDIHAVKAFLDAMWDEKKSNQYVFRLYRELPQPGVSYLSKRSRGALLRRFANPTNRRWADARRFLGLVEDMVAAGLPISRSLWSSAIHLGGRASGRVCKKDLVRSIGLWQQMEHLAGVKSDGVVFSILFDIAIKAGQFTVAERLMEEMARRDIGFSRAGKVSKIYYYGMLREPDGVRQAFDEFVASGEVVDTPVLNCLLASLLRAGETSTGEQLYHSMLQSYQEDGADLDRSVQYQPGLTSEFTSYRKKSRKLNSLLELSASLRNQLPGHHRALQDAFAMVPDTRTFYVLLSFYSYDSGNLEAFRSVLNDMEKTFTIPPRGMIYLLLFSGFARNGRKRKGWTAERLRAVWQTYLRTLYESRSRYNDRLHLRTGKPIWENPLGNSAMVSETRVAHVPHTSQDLYKPLPTADRNDSPITGDRANQDGYHELANADYEDIDTDELFGPRAGDHDGTDGLERQIENGVFLGRRMIIIILRAFGTCCGPHEVMEVWLRIEQLWQPKRRRALDVLAIKEELEKQMNQAGR